MTLLLCKQLRRRKASGWGRDRGGDIRCWDGIHRLWVTSRAGPGGSFETGIVGFGRGATWLTKLDAREGVRGLTLADSGRADAGRADTDRADAA